MARFVTLAELTGQATAWADLCARAAEPNPFAEPGFLLPLIGYERPRLTYALIHSGGRLVGFAALDRPRFGLARVWMSAYAGLPAAAFDRDDAPAALAALADLLRRETRLAGLVLPYMQEGGPLAAALRASGLSTRIAGQTRRAALRLDGAEAFEADLPARRRRHWARLNRRLARAGRLEVEAGGFEPFLAVEPRGWKGERRSALADDPRRLAFARAALSHFAEAGRLDALTLKLDGQPIAAGLALIAGDRAFYWKSAYDEAHAHASPGVQIALAHSRRLAEAPGLTWFDSCAGADHPMIGRVWSEALAFEDRAVALRSERALSRWLAWERRRTGAVERLKRLISRVLGRRRV